jgi:hypothetical protein
MCGAIKGLILKCGVLNLKLKVKITKLEAENHLTEKILLARLKIEKRQQIVHIDR